MGIGTVGRGDKRLWMAAAAVAAGVVGTSLLVRKLRGNGEEVEGQKSRKTNGSEALALKEFDEDQQDRTGRALRLFLGWSVVNLGVGGAGVLIQDDPQWRAFYGANLACGALTGLAVWVGRRGLSRWSEWPKVEESEEGKRPLQRAKFLETLAVADLSVALVSVGGGVYLARGGASPELQGLGRALLLQGVVLVVVDSLYLGATRRQRRKLETKLEVRAPRLESEAATT